MTSDLAPDWRLVLPVKASTSAKSRLVPPPGVARGELAHAFARDTLTAAFATLAPERVLVVTSDARVQDVADAAGAAVVGDPGTGLNGAVREGLRRLADEPGPVGVLLADLPALRPGDLVCALAACEPHARAFVPDADGTGTVLLTAGSATLVEPRFGAGSARAHGRDARRLELDLARLRTDVDDDESLRRAAVLGLGPATRDVLSGVALR